MGVMEGIAACGFETRSPIPGFFSFTNTLIEVLEDWANKKAFSAAMLHTEVLFVLKSKRYVSILRRRKQFSPREPEAGSELRHFKVCLGSSTVSDSWSSYFVFKFSPY